MKRRRCHNSAEPARAKHRRPLDDDGGAVATSLAETSSRLMSRAASAAAATTAAVERALAAAAPAARADVGAQHAAHQSHAVWRAIERGSLRDVNALVAAAGARAVLDLVGPLGETPTLMAFLYGHVELGLALVAAHPRRVLEVYARGPYAGERTRRASPSSGVSIVGEEVERAPRPL